MHKYSEIADILGVTRSTVYNRVSKLNFELKGHIKTRNRVKYITDEGLDILRLYNSTVQLDNNLYSNKDSEHLNALIQLKDEQIEYLKKQYEMQTELLQNSQILLKQEQDKFLMLELYNENQKMTWWEKLFKTKKQE